MYESWNFRFLFVFCFDNVRFFTLARLAAFAATVLVFEKTKPAATTIKNALFLADISNLLALHFAQQIAVLEFVSPCLT